MVYFLVRIYNSSKKFAFVAQSQIKLAKILGIKTPTVKAACDGVAISTCGYYLRWWDPSIEIDIYEELGQLTLKEYDDLCGLERRYYKGRDMSRKSLKLKYNMKSTPEKLKRLRRKNENNQD